jgi:hypothetical protein
VGLNKRQVTLHAQNQVGHNKITKQQQALQVASHFEMTVKI